MKRLLLHPLMVWIYRIVVAVVLLYAGVKKVWMPMEFARLLKEYQILPNQLLNLVAVMLPWIEVVCGVCFITGLWLRGTALLLSGMNAVFAIAIAFRAWLIMATTGIGFFDLTFDCGCGFGVVYIPTKIVENLLLVAVGVLILFSRREVQDKPT